MTREGSRRRTRSPPDPQAPPSSRPLPPRRQGRPQPLRQRPLDSREGMLALRGVWIQERLQRLLMSGGCLRLGRACAAAGLATALLMASSCRNQPPAQPPEPPVSPPPTVDFDALA